MADQGPLSRTVLGGRYQLGDRLGTGGFADVYLAEHLHLKTQLAIKVLTRRLTHEEIEQFRGEAQIIAALEHPYILQVRDFDLENGFPFLVMDYAPNGTLRDRHPQGAQVPLATVVGYMKQVAEALQYAHDRKLIHRDVKPQNMLIGPDDEILLSDFGIAISAGDYIRSHEPIGTAAYMAPEQYQGEPRRASDQYSLAIVVYEWLCGSRPFTGNNLALGFKHVYEAPPPLRDQSRAPWLPPEVEWVVLKSLEKDPKDRFGSISAFARALEQASVPEQPVVISNVPAPLAPPGATPTGPTAPALTPPQAKRPWVTRLLASLAVLIVLSGSLLLGLNLLGKWATAASGTNSKQATPTATPTATATPSKPALGTVKEFALAAGSSALRITTGPDGNLWFTECQYSSSGDFCSDSGQIGRIRPGGTITEFALPGANHGLFGITSGPDGNLWFTGGTDCAQYSSGYDCQVGEIGRITPQGQITEFATSAPFINLEDEDITKGPDGNLWFTEPNGNNIGRITLQGQITEFATDNGTYGITAGPDGNLWFTVEYGCGIGRITPAGQITEFPLLTCVGAPRSITVGPDGNLWFTEPNGNNIGRITPQGQITEFPLPAGSSALRITAGPDGNLWFTDPKAEQIGRITPAGQITEFPLPTEDYAPDDIAKGPDGNLWFTDSTGTIGWISPGP